MTVADRKGRAMTTRKGKRKKMIECMKMKGE